MVESSVADGAGAAGKRWCPASIRSCVQSRAPDSHEITDPICGNLRRLCRQSRAAGLCRNGVYVAGGIAPKILVKLQEGGFIKAFRDKGRFSSLMEEIPVYVVINSKAGLIGAAEEARRMLGALPAGSESAPHFSEVDDPGISRI